MIKSYARYKDNLISLDGEVVKSRFNCPVNENGLKLIEIFKSFLSI